MLVIKDMQIIRAAHLCDTQINTITALLFETGYYEYISVGNKLNLPPTLFQKAQTINPYINHTYALLNADSEVIGFFIVATNTEMQKIENSLPNWYREEHDVQIFLRKLAHFYTHETLPTDLVLYGVAICKIWRGQGLFNLLYQKQLSIAKNNQCSRIVFTVWQSSPAIKVYMHYGAIIMGEIDFTNT